MRTQQIAAYFMKRPTLFWSFVVGIVVAGVIAFSYMPKLEDPPVSPKQAMVVVVYPGASAQQVELKVAQMMEETLRTLPDIHEIRTECENGMAKFTVEFEMTVLAKDLEEHFDLLRRKTNDIAGRLPSANTCASTTTVRCSMRVSSPLATMCSSDPTAASTRHNTRRITCSAGTRWKRDMR